MDSLNSRNEALIDAVRESDMARLNSAIQAGADVDYQIPGSYIDKKGYDIGRGYSSLHIASLLGCLPIVTLLLELNANCNVLNERGGEPLFSAAYNGHFQICELLIQNGATVNHTRAHDGATPLIVASQQGHIAVVELLLQHGANIHQATDNGATPIFRAAQQGHIAVVELLLQHGANVNKATTDKGTTPLIRAAQQGHIAVVKLLLQHGANVNQAKTDNRATPLFGAAFKGHIAIVELLLQHGANVNQAKTDNGATPLSVAAQEGHGAVAELLIQRGASVNQAMMNYDITPLMLASYFAHVNIVELLLSHGASVHHTNNDGETCFTYAGDPELNPNPNRMHGMLYRLRKWPTTMAILALKELALYYNIDCSSLIDLHQYIGTELFTFDNEEDYG